MPEKKKSKAKAVVTHPSVTVPLLSLVTGAACLAAEKFLGPGSGALLATIVAGGAYAAPSPLKK